MELLEDVILDRPAELPRVEAAFLGGGQVERHQDDRRRVDGQGYRGGFQVDAVEEREHVVERVHRDAEPADFTRRARVVAIEAHESGQVECGRETGLPLLQEELEPLVRLSGRAEPGELPHRSETPAVHARVYDAREWVL